MKRFKFCLVCSMVVGVVATTAMAAPVVEVDIYLSVREVGINSPIGGDGGTSGSVGLEFLDRGVQKLALDGTWQQFTWDMATVDVQGWANGNGTLDGPGGIVDAIVIEAAGPTPVTIWMDDWVDRVDPAGLPPAVDHVLADWEGYADDTEVSFQEPGFSGSTSDNLGDDPNFSGVDNDFGYDGAGGDNPAEASMRTEMNIIGNTGSGGLFGYGVRLTTFGAGGTPVNPNPTISFGAAGETSVVTIWMKGLPIPEPTSLSLLVLGGLAVLRRR